MATMFTAVFAYFVHADNAKMYKCEVCTEDDICQDCFQKALMEWILLATAYLWGLVLDSSCNRDMICICHSSDKQALLSRDMHWLFF